MGAANSIKNLMETTVETIKESIDTNTIVGEPIKSNNTIVVPISKVTIGFGIGGGEYSKGYDKKAEEEMLKDIGESANFAGASAGAISIAPVAFVVVEDGETRVMSLDSNINMVDNILTLTPKIIEKIQKVVQDNQKE